MMSIRDPLTPKNGFNKLTDWYSYAIVTFQMYIGIHPFKGIHPDYKPKDLELRMKDGASVFDKKVGEVISSEDGEFQFSLDDNDYLNKYGPDYGIYLVVYNTKNAVLTHGRYDQQGKIKWSAKNPVIFDLFTKRLSLISTWVMPFFSFCWSISRIRYCASVSPYCIKNLSACLLNKEATRKRLYNASFSLELID